MDVGHRGHAAETRRIADFYDRRVTRLGAQPRALDWGSRASQWTRFKVLTQIDDLAGSSVLDVGCGVADLYDYLRSRDVPIDYTGYDMAPAMVAAARRRLPNVDIQMRDIVTEEVPEPQFDFVVASGLFSLRRTQPYDYVAATVHRMYTLCRRGIAMNSLSSRSDGRTTIEDGRFLAAPERVLNICFEVTPKVTLRHDYLPHDFTVYLYK